MGDRKQNNKKKVDREHRSADPPSGQSAEGGGSGSVGVNFSDGSGNGTSISLQGDRPLQSGDMPGLFSSYSTQTGGPAFPTSVSEEAAGTRRSRVTDITPRLFSPRAWSSPLMTTGSRARKEGEETETGKGTEREIGHGKGRQDRGRFLSDEVEGRRKPATVSCGRIFTRQTRCRGEISGTERAEEEAAHSSPPTHRRDRETARLSREETGIFARLGEGGGEKRKDSAMQSLLAAAGCLSDNGRGGSDQVGDGGTAAATQAHGEAQKEEEEDDFHPFGDREEEHDLSAPLLFLPGDLDEEKKEGEGERDSCDHGLEKRLCGHRKERSLCQKCTAKSVQTGEQQPPLSPHKSSLMRASPSLPSPRFATETEGEKRDEELHLPDPLFEAENRRNRDRERKRNNPARSLSEGPSHLLSGLPPGLRLSEEAEHFEGLSVSLSSSLDLFLSVCLNSLASKFVVPQKERRGRTVKALQGTENNREGRHSGGETGKGKGSGKRMCRHGRKKYDCKECGGKGICEHGHRKRDCKECRGTGVCKRERQKRGCKEPGGASGGLCKYGKVRGSCQECREEKDEREREQTPFPPPNTPPLPLASPRPLSPSSLLVEDLHFRPVAPVDDGGEKSRQVAQGMDGWRVYQYPLPAAEGGGQCPSALPSRPRCTVAPFPPPTTRASARAKQQKQEIGDAPSPSVSLSAPTAPLLSPSTASVAPRAPVPMTAEEKKRKHKSEQRREQRKRKQELDAPLKARAKQLGIPWKKALQDKEAALQAGLKVLFDRNKFEQTGLSDPQAGRLGGRGGSVMPPPHTEAFFDSETMLNEQGGGEVESESGLAVPASQGGRGGGQPSVSPSPLPSPSQVPSPLVSSRSSAKKKQKEGNEREAQARKGGTIEEEIDRGEDGEGASASSSSAPPSFLSPNRVEEEREERNEYCEHGLEKRLSQQNDRHRTTEPCRDIRIPSVCPTLGFPIMKNRTTAKRI
uniref:Uncharacterized protein n=1 Tax=Chromera velia CCMP2878 TaxID=1169474 RepID=A0A0G4FTX4_9ALVE|eukprot:Cvel_18735.t1-p1 / transcript=Cvel_18735.t1 / gene=Cvel_18735 / organism=Chromera_velia_CCMP2878 / gene_product=hypothetical protein / transcript_product=hypothetical protein / location=Cvel_scaffold1571:13150-18874(-) / protein_length=971 / sequence_SO=supercontig / SO=protein_coding / is_pseudo=false